VRFEELPSQLIEADIVVSATASPHQIVGRDEMELVAAQRDGRPLLMIDIAVPRDIEPSVREVPGVTLYDMDDLQREVARNMGSREAEAVRARQLVDQEVDRFSAWLASLDVVPSIAALRTLGEDVVQQVLRENEPRWESLSDADRERVSVLARAVVQRMLHEPTLRLKGAVEGDNSYVYVQALRELFGLEIGSVLDESAGAEITQLDSRRRKQR
jgi:glutamyl-tRNA reductase